MGFFQDLKQDLSQTVNDLDAEDAAVDLDLDADRDTATEDLFGSTSDSDLADLEAMLKKEVAALGDGPADAEEPQMEPVAEVDMEAMLDNMDNMQADSGAFAQETAPAVKEQEIPKEKIVTDIPDVDVSPEEISESVEASEEKNISEADTEMEELLNEVEQNVQEPAYMDAEPEPMAQQDQDANAVSAAVSTDTAVITAGMSITGDVTSSGNMDLIGNIVGNIEISGKLNVTGGITGNSSAAEIYAESAQINGEIKSKGSVKIGQSSVVIGNIFASSAVIAGAVKGDIDVHGPVILDTSAIVMGNIKSKSVQINNGAVIEGMCSQCYADVSPSSFFNDVKKNRK